MATIRGINLAYLTMWESLISGQFHKRILKEFIENIPLDMLKVSNLMLVKKLLRAIYYVTDMLTLNKTSLIMRFL